MLGARTAQCPNCGGPIEIALGSSAALVCPHCRFSIVRTDRGLSAIGRVADLVPTAPPIAVGDGVMLAGRGGRVAGRVQLDHGAGPWDEWYVGFDDGTWGWLARAQGQWLLTKLAAPGSLPTFEAIGVGQQFTLQSGGPILWTVSERGSSVVLSAEGELPFVVSSGERGQYVDLSGAGGAFATIDYGTGTPMLFVGRALAPNELSVAQTAPGPRPEERVQVGTMTCPNCGAPIELRDPEHTERLACTYCAALIEIGAQRNLRIVERAQELAIRPAIPIGTDGTLGGEAVKVIGFLERGTVVDGITYTWREYLLYAAQGYRWLVEENGHFTYVRPIAPGDAAVNGSVARYAGRVHRRFSSVSAFVRFVLGEFYWKVEVGERAVATDFIAPPHIVSEERSPNELVWSAGTYIAGREVWKAFGLAGSPLRAIGVGTTEPNPHSPGVVLVTALVLMIGLLALTTIFVWSKSERLLVEGPLPLPPQQTSASTPPPSEDQASYTPVFTVRDGPTTLAIELRTTAQNHYVGVACALIGEDNGEVREFFVSAERYEGETGGERWTEGSPSTTEYIDQVPSGRYTLRLEPQWNQWSPTLLGVPIDYPVPPTATIRVRENSRSPCCGFVAFLLLLAPVPLLLLRRVAFEKRRWSNSNLV